MNPSELIVQELKKDRPIGDRWHAILGDFSGNVNAGLPGWKYVRIQIGGTGDYTLAMFPSLNVPGTEYNSPVMIEYDPKTGQRVIIGPDMQTIGATISGGGSPDPGMYTLPLHAASHQAGGGDQVDVSPIQLTGVQVRPGATTNHVTVGGGMCVAGGVLVVRTNTTATDVDLTAYVPASGVKYVWITVTAANAITVIDPGCTDITTLTLPSTANFVAALVMLQAFQPLIVTNSASWGRIYDGRILIGPANDWHTTGNVGTAAGTNFMGTTDDVDVVFKRNNIEVGRFESTGFLTPLTITAKPTGTAGIQFDPNSATGDFTLSLSPANLTGDQRVTFADTTGTVTLGTGVAGQVAFWSATNVVTGSLSLVYNDTNKVLLLNGGAHDSQIEVAADDDHDAYFSLSSTTHNWDLVQYGADGSLNLIPGSIGNSTWAWDYTTGDMVSQSLISVHPTSAAGIGLDGNAATGDFTCWLSTANLTANRRVTFPNADFTVTGGGTFALGGYTVTVPKTGTVPVGTGTVGRIAEWVTDINTLQASTLIKTGTNTLTLATGAIAALTWTIPANAIGFLKNDGAGALSWDAGIGWMLTGNAGTTPGTNFLGTTDDADLVLKANSVEIARCLSGYGLRVMRSFLDQEQMQGDGWSGDLQGQSFTAGRTGSLQKIEVYLSADPTPSNITIRQGEDMSGALLATGASFSGGPSGGWYVIYFNSTPTLTAGQQYTIRVATGNWNVKLSNVYSGGRGYRGGTWKDNEDFMFKTYISFSQLTVGHDALNYLGVQISATAVTFDAVGASVGFIFSDTVNMTSPAVTTSITTPSTTFALINATATTVNAFGAATTINIGAASCVVNGVGGLTINGGIAANDDITIQGTSHTTRTTSYVLLQPNGGFVGIGCTPNTNLHVVGAVSAYIRAAATDGHSALLLNPSANTKYTWVDYGDGASYGWQMGKDTSTGAATGIAEAFYLFSWKATAGIRLAVSPVGDITPGGHKTQDFGAALTAWDDGYADDWNNVADIPFLDDRDDLAAICGIKPSNIVDRRTGLHIIDDATLPEWLLVKDKKTGKIVRDAEGKPYISLKTMIGLAFGAIRQLATERNH